MDPQNPSSRDRQVAPSGPPPPPSRRSSPRPDDVGWLGADGRGEEELGVLESVPLREPQLEPPRRRVGGLLVALLAGLAGALLALAGLWLLGVFDETEPAPTATVATPTPTPVQNRITIVPTDPTGSIEAVAAAAIPSIVTVQISEELEDGPLPVGSGSGVVFSEDGYILTNDHVIRDAELIEIIFPGGRLYPADVVGTDPLTDIAVVKISAEGLVPIPLADIAKVSIGDLAIAVGNPLGLQGGPSVTSGVVSAFERTLQVGAGQDGRLYGLIQTDAPITRGSSGGALLDETGRLVGVTTAIGVSDVGAEGLGFAVPVDTVSLVVRDLIAEGEVRHAFLGISGDTAFQEADDGADVPIGASIVGLEDEAAIGLAGAQVGDVIRSVDGVPVTTIDQLISLLRKRRAGQTVSVDLLRGARQLTIDVELDVRPESP